MELTICEKMLADMRLKLWVGKSWVGENAIQRMTYLGCIWGCDMSSRISEYTAPEGGAQDHCVRAHNLKFFIKTGKGEQNSSRGSSTIKLILDRDGGLQTVMECSVLAASSKGKEVTKPKVIGRRSVKEEQFFRGCFTVHETWRGSRTRQTLHIIH